MSNSKPAGLTVSEKHKILVSNGILTKEHIEKIQGAIWYFLYAVDKTTEEYRDKETGQVRGRVLGTMPLNDSDVAAILGVKRRTIRRWREQLTEAGYLRTKRTPIGYIVEVANSKKGLLKAESDVTPKVHPSDSDVTQNAHQSPSDVRKSDNRCHQNGHQMSEKVTSNIDRTGIAQDKTTTTPKKPEAVGWLTSFYGQTKKEILPVSKEQKTQLARLAKRDGFESFQKTCQQWIEARNTDGLDQVANKLLEEYDAQQAVVLGQQSRDSFELSKTEADRIIAFSVAKRQKENQEVFEAKRKERELAVATADQI